MNKKNICVIANGYAEEMIAAKLMDELRQQLKSANKADEYQFIGGSLVSSGKWYQQEQFATFFSGGVTPSGGFPTKSWKGFFADLWAGAFFTPFRLCKLIKEWSKYNLKTIIIVGDFLLMMLAVPALKKKNVSLIFIPTAKSDYIQPHFKIEKFFIKKYATVTFPRDLKTAGNFKEYGINAVYHGNLIQDLLDKEAQPIVSKDPIVAILPGSRDEAYKNLELMLDIISLSKETIHWAFVQASSLESSIVEEVFLLKKWKKSEEQDIIVWKKSHHKVFCYPNTMYDNIALSCEMAISLAGTAGEQITGLGKPVIGFTGAGPQSCVSRMESNQKLLGEAFIYQKNSPQGVIYSLEQLYNNPEERKRRGQIGLERMGKSGGTKKIAEYIIQHILEETK